MASLFGSLGIDSSTFDVDGHFEELETEGFRGMVEAFSTPVDGKETTLREVAMNLGMPVGACELIATPRAVRLADSRVFATSLSHTASY